MFNLGLLGLWVGMRLLTQAFARQVRGVEISLPRPAEDEEAELTRVRSLLAESYQSGPFAGRRMLAEARVLALRWMEEGE